MFLTKEQRQEIRRRCERLMALDGDRVYVTQNRDDIERLLLHTDEMDKRVEELIIGCRNHRRELAAENAKLREVLKKATQEKGCQD